MTASTLPKVAVDLFDDGNAWFPFRISPDAPTLWAYSPELGMPTWQWVTTFVTDHACAVLDEATLMELLYTSSLPPTAHPSREELLEIVRARLCVYGCRVEPHPEHDCAPRLACCRAWLAELRGGAA